MTVVSPSPAVALLLAEHQTEIADPPALDQPATRELPSSAELPAPYSFPTSEDSPGVVTFNHDSHVDPDPPACGTCHATIFRINAPGTPHEGELSYERVHEGDLCASCHDGEHAFAVEDDCSFCHF